MLTDGYHDVPLGKLAMVVTHLEMREAAPLRDVVGCGHAVFHADERWQ